MPGWQADHISNNSSETMNHLPRRFGDLFVLAAQSYQRPYWQPAVDAYRTPHGWLLKYELAGVAPEDVELHLAGNAVTIRGVRRDVRIDETCQSYCMEISYNQFERTLELPCELNTMDVATQYQNGMLLVRLTCREDCR
jgi:HSP20 family protein